MKLPMNTDIYSIGFVSETIWRRIVSGATGTRATIIKWSLGGLSNLFIFISVSYKRAKNHDTGYPHDGRADNTAYQHDRRADKRRYRHDREIDIQMLKMFRNGYILS